METIDFNQVIKDNISVVGGLIGTVTQEKNGLVPSYRAPIILSCGTYSSNTQYAHLGTIKKAGGNYYDCILITGKNKPTWDGVSSAVEMYAIILSSDNPGTPNPAAVHLAGSARTGVILLQDNELYFKAPSNTYGYAIGVYRTSKNELIALDTDGGLSQGPSGDFSVIL